MPKIKTVKTSEIPQRKYRRASRFGVTPEWQDMQKKIGSGLPKGESCYLSLTGQDWERMGLSGTPLAGHAISTGSKSAVRFIRQYLAAQGIHRHTVRTSKSGIFDLVIVDGPPLHASKTGS